MEPLLQVFTDAPTKLLKHLERKNAWVYLLGRACQELNIILSTSYPCTTLHSSLMKKNVVNYDNNADLKIMVQSVDMSFLDGYVWLLLAR